MENQELFLKNDNFPAEFKNQDLTKLPSFQKWYTLKKKENKKIVQCPLLLWI